MILKLIYLSLSLSSLGGVIILTWNTASTMTTIPVLYRITGSFLSEGEFQDADSWNAFELALPSRTPLRLHDLLTQFPFEGETTEEGRGGWHFSLVTKNGGLVDLFNPAGRVPLEDDGTVRVIATATGRALFVLLVAAVEVILVIAMVVVVVVLVIVVIMVVVPKMLS